MYNIILKLIMYQAQICYKTCLIKDFFNIKYLELATPQGATPLKPTCASSGTCYKLENILADVVIHPLFTRARVSRNSFDFRKKFTGSTQVRVFITHAPLERGLFFETKKWRKGGEIFDAHLIKKIHRLQTSSLSTKMYWNFFVVLANQCINLNI